MLRAENAELRIANDRLSQRRRTKKHRLQDGGLLTVGDAQNLESIRSGVSQLQVVLPGNASRTKTGPATRRCCTRCGKHGHNVQTCENIKEEPEDLESDNN